MQNSAVNTLYLYIFRGGANYLPSALPSLQQLLIGLGPLSDGLCGTTAQVKRCASPNGESFGGSVSLHEDVGDIAIPMAIICRHSMIP